MKLRVLGSSSHGNCYILQTPTGSLLLDAGVPFREIQKGLDFEFSDVWGCLLTHEHGDHSKGIKDLMKYGIPVFSSIETFKALGVDSRHSANSVKPNQQFNWGDFTILPFDVQHDAAQPLGYLIQYRPTGEKLLFATDTYYLKYRFQGLNYILVECNYCPDILKANIEAGRIPESLKNRLLESHFSLDNVKGFLQANDLSQVRKIILIHLSDGNSDAARMVREIEELTDKETVVADVGMEIDLSLYPF
jgi:phosphoribosyl 1,2-cyclic phosphodiesterase